MTEAEVRARLESMLGGDAEPTLTGAEVDTLMVTARVPDAFGRASTDPAWDPTYHLAPAAAEGWAWKAAKVAGNYHFTADGGSFHRDQVLEHCLKMAAHFRALSGAHSIPVQAVGTSPQSLWVHGQIGNA